MAHPRDMFQNYMASPTFQMPGADHPQQSPQHPQQQPQQSPQQQQMQQQQQPPQQQLQQQQFQQPHLQQFQPHQQQQFQQQQLQRQQQYIQQQQHQQQQHQQQQHQQHQQHQHQQHQQQQHQHQQQQHQQRQQYPQQHPGFMNMGPHTGYQPADMNLYQQQQQQLQQHLQRMTPQQQQQFLLHQQQQRQLSMQQMSQSPHLQQQQMKFIQQQQQQPHNRPNGHPQYAQQSVAPGMPNMMHSHPMMALPGMPPIPTPLDAQRMNSSQEQYIHIVQEQQQRYRFMMDNRAKMMQQQQQSAMPKRPTRNAKKKKASYEESEEEEELEYMDEESEQEQSDFEGSDEDEESNRKGKGTESGEEPAEDEQVVIPMGTKVFERILDYRVNEETGEDEFLIKYKHTSFHHVDWVSQKQVEAEHLGKHRVKKFLKKWEEDGEKGEDFREFLKMDRIIDEGEIKDPVTGENKVYYLVKWNNSFYDACTWENEDDVEEINEALIDEFVNRRQVPPEKLNPPPPPAQIRKYEKSPAYKYGNELRSYQLDGLNWLRFQYCACRPCILADEMGLGKTVQSVAFLYDLYYTMGVRGPFLIVAPLSTIPHWERAFKAWTDLNVIDYRGSVTSRKLIAESEFYYKDMEGNDIPGRYKFDVLITTYEMAQAGAFVLDQIVWQCAIFDEAHRLKNRQSKVGEILKSFTMRFKVLLTGTPLQNNVEELFSLLNFMDPAHFYDEQGFIHAFGDMKNATQVRNLQETLKYVMLRRFKEDVEETIPVKEETIIEVELTTPQKKWYRAILEKNFSFLKKGTKTNKDMPHLRNVMMQLRKCCLHPYLLEGAEEVITSECNAKTTQDLFNCLVQSSGKLVLIDKLLRKLIKGNHKVLIFSQFTSCLDILGDYLKKCSYAFERIDGSVPGDQRQAAIDRFSTCPIEESFVFLLCTRAGGVGINLTAADTCIIFDSDWNPQNDLQAQARCHRIGQTKPVQIYRLICANTYEKDMFDRAGLKLGLDRAVMSRSGHNESGDDGSPARQELDKKQIEDLLKKGAYGAMLDDEASRKFCAEDIDQILEQRTKVIRHESREQGSVFSKATFSAGDDDGVAVDLDDPDFWEKWAAKANIDTTEVPEENKLIMSSSRRRRRVKRYGSRQGDDNYSDNDNGDDSDAAYEEEPERPSRKRDQARLWSLSEKTRFERKLMIFGHGRWDLMQAHFDRRSEEDLKAVTHALMRKVLPTIEKNKEEDRRLIDDIETILETHGEYTGRGSESSPYPNATKRQIAEFQSFLSPPEYVEQIERKGRNLLLRIQMLYQIRDRIVPQDWEEAKMITIPKVTGAAPAMWWGEDEDRSLLLGVCKHGYQQYLTIRNDPEFCFRGRKYDDSQSGPLDDEDAAANGKNEDDNSREGSAELDEEKDEDDDEVYIWPSKSDLGTRLRRIITAFTREMESESRKRKAQEKKESSRRTRQRRQAPRSRAKANEAANRWSKKNSSDFIKALKSIDIESIAGEPQVRWEQFKKTAGLDKKSDESVDLHLQGVKVACEEAAENRKEEGATSDAEGPKDVKDDEESTLIKPEANNTPEQQDVSDDKADQEKDAHLEEEQEPKQEAEQEAKPEPALDAEQEPEAETEDATAEEDEDETETKTKHTLKRIELIRTIHEEMTLHPELDAHLLNTYKTTGLSR